MKISQLSTALQLTMKYVLVLVSPFTEEKGVPKGVESKESLIDMTSNNYMKGVFKEESICSVLDGN